MSALWGSSIGYLNSCKHTVLEHCGLAWFRKRAWAAPKRRNRWIIGHKRLTEGLPVICKYSFLGCWPNPSATEVLDVSLFSNGSNCTSVIFVSVLVLFRAMVLRREGLILSDIGRRPNNKLVWISSKAFLSSGDDPSYLVWPCLPWKPVLQISLPRRWWSNRSRRKSPFPALFVLCGDALFSFAPDCTNHVVAVACETIQTKQTWKFKRCLERLPILVHFAFHVCEWSNPMLEADCSCGL